MKQRSGGDGSLSATARTARTAEWSYRRATSSLRALPNFIVIGAPRAGTTSIWEHLAGHPDVVPAFKKEVHYFDYRHRLGISWYRAHFPLRRSLREGRITGEATPNYLGFPNVAERVASVVPAVKLLALLRNPIDRTYSAWQLKVREGVESLPFGAAIEAEDRRVAEARGRPGASLRYAYRGKSRYAEELERWFEFFPREQLAFFKSEDLFAEDRGALADLYRFLGIRRTESPSSVLVPKANASPVGDGIDPEIRRELAEYFEPHNRLLYALIGHDLGWS